jgi:NTE family protein
MSGGGARAAYQVGFLKFVAECYPDLEVQIITGVSAGAINAAHIANHDGPFSKKIDDLVTLWSQLTPEQVFEVAAVPTFLNVVRWGARLMLGSASRHLKTRSLLDPSPLETFIRRALGTKDGSLPGVRRNLDAGRLKALAVIASCYSTGESVTWVQGDSVSEWARDARVGYRAELTLDHIMASASLPFFFPAVRVGDNWYGDGGMRMTAPLSPAVRLGATRILAISTRHDEEGRTPEHQRADYPPPAQLAGALFNSIFLDGFDADALRIKRINSLIEELPPARRQQLSVVHVAMVRPSLNLGTLANEYEPQMPPTFRFMERGLGTRETGSNDMLSLLMFQSDYLSRLIEIGYEDAYANRDEICKVIEFVH